MKPFASLFLALMIATLVPACGDDGGDGGGVDAPVAGDAAQPDAAPGGCRDSTTCDPNEGCVGPNDINCGIPPMEGCEGDQDCLNPGDVCHATYDSCSFDRVGSMCGPACTPGDPCGGDFVCGQNGACVPVACDDPAYDCPASQVCDPASIDPAGPVHAITHGCTTIACTDDAPCPGTTVCVNSYCQDGLGVCSPPAP